MTELIIVCATILIGFFGYLYYKASQVYVDTIEKWNGIVDNKNRNIGKEVWYKRTYKNGKVTYFHREYT